MIVEALICIGGNDGTPSRWGLREVKAEKHWKKYMEFACTPGAAMYGKPMVYVQFISATDDAGCSTGAGDVNLTITAAPITGQSQPVNTLHRSISAGAGDIGLRSLTSANMWKD